MDTKAKIKKVEEALKTIEDFLLEDIKNFDEDTLNGWNNLRKGVNEHLYYMYRDAYKD